MQKHVNLVDLVKSFPASISLKILASIQKRTRPIKFDHLAEKSDKGSISNLSTKFQTVCAEVHRRDHLIVEQHEVWEPGADSLRVACGFLDRITR